MKIGIDLGGSHIAIGVIDTKGKILEKVEKRITSTEKNNIKKEKPFLTEWLFNKAVLRRTASRLARLALNGIQAKTRF